MRAQLEQRIKSLDGDYLRVIFCTSPRIRLYVIDSFRFIRIRMTVSTPLNISFKVLYFGGSTRASLPSTRWLYCSWIVVGFTGLSPSSKNFLGDMYGRFFIGDRIVSLLNNFFGLRWLCFTGLKQNEGVLRFYSTKWKEIVIIFRIPAVHFELDVAKMFYVGTAREVFTRMFDSLQSWYSSVVFF